MSSNVKPVKPTDVASLIGCLRRCINPELVEEAIRVIESLTAENARLSELLEKEHERLYKMQEAQDRRTFNRHYRCRRND